MFYDCKNFPYGKFIKKLAKEKYNIKGGKKLVNYVCSFDTETTNIVLDGKKLAFVYLWGFSFNNEFYVAGRTMQEFMQFIDNMIEFLSMYELNIAIYCHNLSFDYTFIFNFSFDNSFTFSFILSIFIFSPNDFARIDEPNISVQQQTRYFQIRALNQYVSLKDSFFVLNQSPAKLS